jgi:hypothetical protein
MPPINGLSKLSTMWSYKHFVPTARRHGPILRHATASRITNFSLSFLSSLSNLYSSGTFCVICGCLTDDLAGARPVASPIQTPLVRARSKSSRTFAKPHPSPGSCSAKSKSSGRSGPVRFRASTVDSLPAIDDDIHLSESQVLPPSHADCCRSRRCNNAAAELSCGRRDSDRLPNTDR